MRAGSPTRTSACATGSRAASANKSLGRGAASTSLGRSPRRPQRRAAASPVRAPAAPAVDASVKDLIKNYRRAAPRRRARRGPAGQSAGRRGAGRRGGAPRGGRRASSRRGRRARPTFPPRRRRDCHARRRPAAPAAAADPGHAGLGRRRRGGAPRRGVEPLDAEIDVGAGGGALKAAGDRVTAASLEERAREAAATVAPHRAGDAKCLQGQPGPRVGARASTRR